VGAVSAVVDGSAFEDSEGAAKDDSFGCPPKAPNGLADGLAPASDPNDEAVSRAKALKPEEANALAEVCGCDVPVVDGLVPARAPNGDVAELLANPLAAGILQAVSIV